MALWWRKRRVNEPELSPAELAWLEIDEPRAFLDRFVMGDEDARTWAGTGTLLTTDRPGADASSARSPLTFYGLSAAAADTALADLTAGGNHENVG